MVPSDQEDSPLTRLHCHRRAAYSSEFTFTLTPASGPRTHHKKTVRSHASHSGSSRLGRGETGEDEQRSRPHTAARSAELVILDTKLNFSIHISQTVSKANRALGIMIRSFQTSLPRQKFSKNALRATYFANVRSDLEYGCVVWGGAAKSHMGRLERVQHKFLMWMAHRSRNVDTRSLNYEQLLKAFDVPTIKARCLQYDLVFLRNVYSGQVDSPHLLNCFPLHVPTCALHVVYTVCRAVRPCGRCEIGCVQ